MSQKILVVTTRPLEAKCIIFYYENWNIKSLLNVGVDITVISAQIQKTLPQYNNSVDIENVKGLH